MFGFARAGRHVSRVVSWYDCPLPDHPVGLLAAIDLQATAIKP